MTRLLQRTLRRSGMDEEPLTPREKAADALALAGDRLLAGLSSRVEFQRALATYWATIPLGPEKNW